MPALDLFCRVIDNYGDMGVCWRLARQLRQEHGWQVRLWIDALDSLARLLPEIALVEEQEVQGVQLRWWREPFAAIDAREIPELVIEGFGCRLPDNYLQAMAQRQPAPAWINLEYLSAEDWVEGCHGLPSRHPSLGLTKHFYFPGFTKETGGLIAERGLQAARRNFDLSAQQAFLNGLKVQRQPEQRLLNLFCYPHAPLDGLLDSLRGDARESLLLVPEGVAQQALAQFLDGPAVAGARASHGALSLQVLPFLSQDDYDRLLWCGDFNFVRGEDSFVRAQWAERPFLWHIYPQEEAAHLLKLDAFLERYCAGLPPPLALQYRALMHGWNTGQWPLSSWQALWNRDTYPILLGHARNWADALHGLGDLASGLLRFTKESC
jgi:uncharacterized repeat protein (TIGR03837 family)